MRAASIYSAAPRTWFLPAYRYKPKGGNPLLLVWCPWCKAVHTHGDTGGPIERRGGHCWTTTRGRVDYALVPVARVTSERHVPRLSVTETIAVSLVVAAGAERFIEEMRQCRT